LYTEVALYSYVLIKHGFLVNRFIMMDVVIEGHFMFNLQHIIVFDV